MHTTNLLADDRLAQERVKVFGGLIDEVGLVYDDLAERRVTERNSLSRMFEHETQAEPQLLHRPEDSRSELPVSRADIYVRIEFGCGFQNQRQREIAENTVGVHGHEIAVSAVGRTAFVPIYGSSGVGKPGIDGHEILVIDIPSRTSLLKFEMSF